MKTARIGCMVLGVALLMFVIAPVASAQIGPTPPNQPGFAIWDGTLLQLKMQAKGYYYSPTTRNNLNEYDDKISDKETQYGIVTGDITGTFEIDVYSKDPDTKACVYERTLPLYYVAGSQLQFVAAFLINEVDISYATGTVIIDAKLNSDNNGIKSGSIKTVGAYAIEQGFDVPLDLAVSGLTLSGKVVKELGCNL
jgi:hypothetical protein